MEKTEIAVEQKVNTRQIEHRAWKENAEHCSWCDNSGFMHAKKKESGEIYGFCCPYCRASSILGLSLPLWDREKHSEKFDPINLLSGFGGM